ncbi:hypothetical protein Xaut_3657 [Xanthobacter versatilis]|uniref:Uncharacterized protein n=1 Tax=Xanthobacter autotrophicus (strain ATCC BAA-1158 / Py2) TaxID=78245 RepID=A7ILJ2_XANP2|nr:hypothetical protein Xaut_3657 [Xanthobacter autotrophicus Py2]
MALVDPTLGYTWWDRTNDFNDTANAGGTGGNTVPTKPFALMSYGGKSYLGAIHNTSWTYDATSKTYSMTRSAVATVVDISSLSNWGVFKRLTKITAGADLAATRTLVGAAPGSYAVTAANDVVVRLETDAVVSDATVRVVLSNDAFKPGAVSAYVSDFNFVGGVNGVVNATATATRNLAFDGCSAGFGGIDLGAKANSWGFNNSTGLIVLRKCSAASGQNDLFNFHQTAGSVNALMIDCSGIDAGRAGSSPVSLSNQIVTAHENVRLLTINTDGSYSSGGCVRSIGTSQHWDLGSTYSYDRGDVRYAGGSVNSIGVGMNESTKYWGDSITVQGCMNTFYAESGAQIYLRAPIEIGGVRAGAGLITSY